MKKYYLLVVSLCLLSFVFGFPLHPLRSCSAQSNEPSACQSKPETPESCRSQTDVQRRIKDLIGQMTLEEKVGQMSQYAASRVYPKELAAIITCTDERGIAQAVQQGAIGSFLNARTPRIRNAFQKIAVEKSRLKIPLVFGYDVIHGYRTIFPIPLGESASWNLELMEQTAVVAAKEARSAGIEWTFAPMVDIARDPRWGRIAEGAGEDAYLGSCIARAKVRGYQGDSLASGETLASCLKHYAAYGAAQAGRDYHTVDISERTLREVYLPPFEAGVEEGAATLMTAFNEISGVPASGNKRILNDILRGEWGFDGVMVSDYTAIEEMVAHGFARDLAEAGRLAIEAQVTMEMVSNAYLNHLPALVRAGTVSEKAIDREVERILQFKFDLGLFDKPYIDETLREKTCLLAEHQELARQMVRESLILLKNEGDILPLRPDITSIALIGPLADNRDDLNGTWKCYGEPNDVISVRAGLETALPNCEIHYVKGCEIEEDSTEGFDEAIAAANQSELVIMAVGESRDHSGEAHCRTNLDLPGRQQRLVEAIHKTGKPMIVLVIAGRPLTIECIYENIPSVLFTGHPGTQGGNGIADVLVGRVNPSGKTTVTFPRRVGQIPIHYNMKNTGRPPATDRYFSSKYLDCSWEPLIPFGYGLSYTNFTYSNLKVSSKTIKIPGTVTISANIENTGTTAGKEVVQLYVRDVVGSVTRPVKELKGFKKVSIPPGQKKTVSFELSTNDLQFYDINMNYSVEPGEFQVWIGPDSISGLEGRFELVD